jgi:hypothetical protein
LDLSFKTWPKKRGKGQKTLDDDSVGIGLEAASWEASMWIWRQWESSPSSASVSPNRRKLTPSGTLQGSNED